jgi:hypothetical protein
MRRLAIVLAVVSVALVLPASSAHASVTSATTGATLGRSEYFFATQEIDERGGFRSDGQLGTGTFHLALHFSACSGDTMTITGTASFVRSDGAGLRGTANGVFACNIFNRVGQALNVSLTNGTRDLTSGTMTLTRVHATESVPIPDGGTFGNSWLLSATIVTTKRVGYWMLDGGGTVYPFGGLMGHGAINNPAVTHIEPTPGANGYWLVDRFGAVDAEGDAHWYGNADRRFFIPGETVVSLSATPTGHGYWLFTSRGRVEAHGDATKYGDLGNIRLNRPVVGSIATPSGHGYYMVASDGGVFTFGDAVFRGSTGAMHLNQPVVGIVPTHDDSGYWLVASDGGVFAFHAPFRGSMGGTPLNRPIVGMVRYGVGYMMVASDGGIFNFAGTAPFFGSLGANPPAKPIVSVAAAS